MSRRVILRAAHRSYHSYAAAVDDPFGWIAFDAHLRLHQPGRAWWPGLRRARSAPGRCRRSRADRRPALVLLRAGGRWPARHRGGAGRCGCGPRFTLRRHASRTMPSARRPRRGPRSARCSSRRDQESSERPAPELAEAPLGH